MNFSTRGRYGLRALTDMALHAAEGPVALRVVAERQNISESYLEQVFTILRKSGLVRSIRGAQGGYELSRPPKEITVGEILRILEGPIVPVHCVDSSNPKPECENEKSCITRPFWEELRDTINTFLDQTTLQDLVDKAPQAANELPMYYI
ncbi:MAG TPA: Rrf2 family transcriptional regulator [Bacillota bacterium]|nr:Rrf2 family transcriptional regulator [Bacillota bacterium]